MFTIDCMKDHSEVQTREFKNKQGEIKEMHSQDLFAHLGGPFPQKISVSIEGPEHALEIGKYKLTQESFKVGQYDRLELDGFNLAKTLVKA